MCQLSPVTFHGDTIFCIDYQNQPFTPMRPIVENMGLAWQAQAAKLTANKERWTVTMIVTVAQDGIEREMLSMPVRKLPAWLNSINPKKVRPELRPKIELYQAESDDALWNYWMKGRAERVEPVQNLHESPLPGPMPSITPSTTADRAPLRSLVNAWARVSGMPHEACWAQLRAAFTITNIKELPAEWVPDAIAWVQEKIDSLQRTVPASPGTGSTQRRLPATRRPSHAPALPPLISGDELKFFDYVCNQARLGIRTYRKMVYDRGENLYTNILKDMLPGENNQARREALAKVFHHALWDMIDRMCWCSGDELQPEHNPAVAVKIFLDALSASAVTSNGRA